jgi:hypothetical protein
MKEIKSIKIGIIFLCTGFLLFLILKSFIKWYIKIFSPLDFGKIIMSLSLFGFLIIIMIYKFFRIYNYKY